VAAAFALALAAAAGAADEAADVVGFAESGFADSGQPSRQRDVAASSRATSVFMNPPD
jgi:hypothetical protein